MVTLINNGFKFAVVLKLLFLVCSQYNHPSISQCNNSTSVVNIISSNDNETLYMQDYILKIISYIAI